MQLIRLAHFIFDTFITREEVPCNREYYNSERQTKHMDIRFENKEIYGGLHGGAAMQVFVAQRPVVTQELHKNGKAKEADLW